MGIPISSTAGGSYRSADAGSRVVLDDDGLRFYDASDNIIVNLEVATASANFLGTIESGSRIIGAEFWMPSDSSSVDRLRIDDLGTGPKLMWLRGGSGAVRGEIDVQFNEFFSQFSTWMNLRVDDADADPSFAQMTLSSGNIGGDVPTIYIDVTAVGGESGGTGSATLQYLSGIKLELDGVARARDLVQAGSVVVNLSGTPRIGSASVGFPKVFPSAPHVVASGGGGSGRYVCTWASITTSGVTIHARDLDGTATQVDVRWVAVGGLA